MHISSKFMDLQAKQHIHKQELLCDLLMCQVKFVAYHRFQKSSNFSLGTSEKIYNQFDKAKLQHSSEKQIFWLQRQFFCFATIKLKT